MGNQVTDDFFILSQQALGCGMLVGGQDSIAVLMYQVGEIAKCSVYSEVAVNSECPSDSRLYDRLMGPALADTLMQVQLIAHEYNFNFDDLLKDGVERFKQRIHDRGGDA